MVESQGGQFTTDEVVFSGWAASFIFLVFFIQSNSLLEKFRYGSLRVRGDAKENTVGDEWKVSAS